MGSIVVMYLKKMGLVNWNNRCKEPIFIINGFFHIQELHCWNNFVMKE